MIHIILDTNFFMISHKNKIDIIEEINKLVSEEHQLITFAGVIQELTKITEDSRGRDGVAAKVALELIKESNLKILEDTGYVDDLIIEYIEKNKDKEIIVCTADAELKKKIKELNIKLICMRSKDKLEFC